MTIHNIKKLGFPLVIIPCLTENHGNIPEKTLHGDSRSLGKSLKWGIATIAMFDCQNQTFLAIDSGINIAISW